MTVYRYPLSAMDGYSDQDVTDPSTVATDFLMLHRHKVNYDDGKAGNNFYSRKNPGNQQKVIYDKDVCYIAMPPSLQTAYGPAYKRMDIGVSGVTMTQLLDGGKDMTSIAESIQSAAKAAMPEFGTNAALQIANSFNQFLGLQGSIDLNTIEQLRNGRIFNPFSEQIFAGMSFRTHNFAFKFFIRNEDEAKHVYKIIRYLKVGALPDIGGGKFDESLIDKRKKFDVPKRPGSQGDIERKKNDVFDKDYFKNFQDGYANDDRYFIAPDRFDLRFCRFKNGAGNQPTRVINSGKQKGKDVDDGRKDLHFKMYPSVCTGIQVNYTPDNQYISRKRPGREQMDVPAVVVSASFTETRLLTKRDVKKGY